MVENIPVHLRKQRRIENKWSIHEWACHLFDSQDLLLDRFLLVDKNPNYEIPAHLPDFSETMTIYLKKDLFIEVQIFKSKRKHMIKTLSAFTMDFYRKQIKHQEYSPFTPFDLLRHILFIDHVHLFQIERLWLTKDQYL
jgi:hypothetical protein